MNLQQPLSLKTKLSCMPSPTGIIQRKCSCGNHAAGGECEECKKKKGMLRRKSSAGSVVCEAPPIVYDVLQSPGQPLDMQMREFMEPRFAQESGKLNAPSSIRSAASSTLNIGPPHDRFEQEADTVADHVTSSSSFTSDARYDFGHVRIHTDAKAAESAKAVNALAYTVGRDVVFGEGQYQPTTHVGRKLMAHELTHVVQQFANPASVQRACGTKQISGIKGCFGLGSDVSDYGMSSDDIYKFKVGCDDFLAGEEERFRELVATMDPDQIVDVHGFASEEGPEKFNEDLSCARAHKATGILEKSSLNVRYVYMHGAKKGIREEMRSVILDFVGSTKRPAQPAPPKFVCGPDITDALGDTVRGLKSKFDSLPDDEQEDQCGALDSILSGSYAWDIIPLYNENNSWIYKYYRPKCASKGATPVCGETVQVGDQCYYTGSANYVIFGVMCRLCQQNLHEDEASNYDEDHMLELIDAYKGPGVFSSASGNYLPSRKWAQAGYHGWPSGGTPPAGDRNNCEPKCPTAFWGPTLDVRWCPHIDPGSQCGLGSRRRRTRGRVRP